MDGIIAYLLSKKFTKDTVIGMGAIKGAACQVQSINKVNKTTTITLKWEDNTGVSHTQSFDIEDGLDGTSIVSATIKPNGHLELGLSDGTSIDCGQVLPQYTTMPTPSASNVGQILQYIGTTPPYTNGYFYECVNDGGVYKWVEKSVQDSYTKIEIGNLTNLPDNTKDVVQNINTLKLSIDQLQASKLSISDIDNALSSTSENPVQNKVIKLTIDQLRGSILDKLADKEDRFRYTEITMPTADSTNAGKIIQYIGTTDATYTNGYFYQCRETSIGSGVYTWVQKNVQPSSGGTGGDGVVDGYYNSADQLFYEESTFINPITGDDNTIYVSLDTNLLYRYNDSTSKFIRVDEYVGEDDVINGYYNSVDGKFYEDSTYTTEITGETGKIYISIDTNIQYRWDNISVPNKFVTISSSIDVDNAFSLTSENPVQNKVITAKINDLDALMATKLSLSDVDGALSGTSLNPVQNKVIKTEIDKLSASMLSASMKEKLVKLEPIYMIGSGLSFDSSTGKLTATGISIPVDDKLDASSLNPVQNKVITLTIDALQGSLSNKIGKMLSAQEDNFAIWDNKGEIKDSGIHKDAIPLLQGSMADAKADITLLQGSVLNIKNDITNLQGSNITIKNDIRNLQGSVLNIKTDINTLQGSLLNKQNKLTEGNGINIDINNKISVDISYLTASRVGYIPNSEKGAHSGVAELDSTGRVPSSQLPSYIDDVIDGYYNDTDGKFYEDSAYTTEIVGEGGKIYISVDTDIQYRWTGTAFAALGGALQLGETSSTAYRGDRGKIAYDHSQIKDGSNPHNTTADNVNLKVPIPALSGSKLDVESTLYGINTELGKKADKVTSATNGHLAGLDSNGNLTDSGVVANDVIQKVATATGLLKDDGTVDTTEYQPKTLAVPIQTLSGSQLTVETALDGINEDVVKTFTGTQAQWDALSLADKQKYEICNITDDGSTDNVYTVGEVDGLLADKVSYEDNNILGAKNLLPNTAITTTTAQGITYVVNSDGTVSIASGQTTTTYTNLTLGSVVLPVGDYILSGCPSGGGANTYRLRLVTGSTLIGIDSGNGYSFHADGNTNYTFTIGLSASGTTYTIPSNLLFKPMVRLDSDVDDTYQPYAETNYQLTKNKMSYVDNGILGAKNLLPNNGITNTLNGVTFTVNSNGSVTVNGTATADTQITIYNGKFKAGNYIVSKGNTNEFPIVTVYSVAKAQNLAVVQETEVPVTIDSSDANEILSVVWVSSGTTVTNQTVYPMIRLASDPDNTYQPYAMTNKTITDFLQVKSKEISSGLTIAAGAIEQVADITLKGKIFSGYSIYNVQSYNINVTQAYCNDSNGAVIAIKNNGSSSITTGKITVYYAG